MESLILRMENGTITNNLDLYEVSVEETLKKYNYIVTEENYKDAEEDRKHIKDEVAGIKRERIDFEKEMLESWTPIKKRLMEVEKKIEASANELDRQIKELDDQKKEEKKELIRQVYEVYGLPVAFEKVLDPKWLNKSCATSKWKKELEEKVARITNEMELIRCFMPYDKGDALQVQELYLDTLDIGRAKAKSDELISLREKASQMAQNQPEKEIAPVIENVDFKQEMEMEYEDNYKEPTRKRLMVKLDGPIEFFNKMNELIKKYNVECRVMEREEY